MAVQTTPCAKAWLPFADPPILDSMFPAPIANAADIAVTMAIALTAAILCLVVMVIIIQKVN